MLPLSYVLSKRYQKAGQGNSTVISVSVYQAGDPGSRRFDPLVLERWNSITVLLTRSHQY